MKNVGKNSFNAVIFLAVSVLLVSIILPFFDVWGGLFPDWDDAVSFVDVIEGINEDPDDLIYRVSTVLRMSAFIPSMFLVLAAFCKSKTGVLISSGTSICLLVFNLIRFIAEEGTDEVFKFDDCSVSFGFWVALVLFIICFICAININNSNVDREES